MKLLTYRIDINTGQARKLRLQYLYEQLLKDDPYWHFFQDEGGITLRVSEDFGKKLEKLMKKEVDRRDDYEPAKGEYPDIKFLGDDWIPLFHELSVLSIKYPAGVMNSYVLERLGHAIVNQGGLFDFQEEAFIYAGLAIKRAVLGGKYGRADED